MFILCFKNRNGPPRKDFVCSDNKYCAQQGDLQVYRSQMECYSFSLLLNGSAYKNVLQTMYSILGFQAFGEKIVFVNFFSKMQSSKGWDTIMQSISVDSYRTETSTSNLRQIQYEYFNFIILFKFVNSKS